MIGQAGKEQGELVEQSPGNVSDDRAVDPADDPTGKLEEKSMGEEPAKIAPAVPIAAGMQKALSDKDDSQKLLCDLLLEVVGRHPTRLSEARHHVHVLRQAYELMTEPQKSIARERIRKLETKWGPALEKAGEIDCTSKEDCQKLLAKKIAGWVSTRKNPERLLLVLNKAAKALLAGKNRLSDIVEAAYETETDRILSPVGYDSFREWLIQLGIGKPVKIAKSKTIWEPAVNCKVLAGDYESLKKDMLKALEKV